jgi:hypothetical protein
LDVKNENKKNEHNMTEPLSGVASHRTNSIQRCTTKRR